ncbi:hypothetical protein ACLMJK_002159 [Lecanora helva]
MAEFEAPNNADSKRVKVEPDVEARHDHLKEFESGLLKQIARKHKMRKMDPLALRAITKQRLSQKALLHWANPEVHFRDLEASGAALYIQEPGVGNRRAFKRWLEQRYPETGAELGSPLLRYLLEVSEEMPRRMPRFCHSWSFLTTFLDPAEFSILNEERHYQQRMTGAAAVGSTKWSSTAAKATTEPARTPKTTKKGVQEDGPTALQNSVRKAPAFRG